MDAAIDAGIDFLDTADVYGCPQSPYGITRKGCAGDGARTLDRCTGTRGDRRHPWSCF